MPELPEVETVKNGLLKNVLNKKILNVSVNAPKLRYPIDADIFKTLKNEKIKDVQRRGKHLIIFIKNDLQIIVHLGMSGVIKLDSEKNYLSKKHDHIVIKLEDDLILSYNDPRRFGYWLFNENNNPLTHHTIAKHGVEPLTDDFNHGYLYEKLVKTSRKIKQVIMDNSIVVGAGNIYASEALFDSNILPTRPANTLKKNEVKKLVASIKKILIDSIAQGGTRVLLTLNGYG